MKDRDTHLRKITDISRKELHELVWQTPLIKLAAEFGITGGELSRICKQNSVTFPSAGYWTRIAFGQAPPAVPLPGPDSDWGRRIELRPLVPRPAHSKQAVTPVAPKTTLVVPPQPLDVADLHPLIRAWVTEHKRLQSERAAEIKNRKGRETDWWGSSAIADLTARDLYRFRMTSDLLCRLERSGVAIKNAAVTGKLSFVALGHAIECTVIEKMTRRLIENRTWTAFPGHHQGGLVSTGFLRIAVTTYLSPAIPEWVETSKKKMTDLIPEVVERILGAPAILDRMAAEHREFLRKFAEDIARREEVARKRHLEKVRFERLSELAENWYRAQQLTSFIDELERRSENDREARLDGKSLADWIGWARQRVAVVDPFQRQPTDIFGLFVGDG